VRGSAHRHDGTPIQISETTFYTALALQVIQEDRVSTPATSSPMLAVDASTPLAHTVFRRFTLVFVVVVALLTVANYIVGQPWFVTGQLMLTLAVQCGALLLARIERYFFVARLLALVNVYVMCLMQWFFNAGINGPSAIVFLCICLFSLCIFSRGRVILALLNVALFLMTLMMSELQPQWVQPYGEPMQRLIDHGAGYVIGAVYVTLLMVTVLSAYQSEQRKSQDMHDVVVRQNAQLLAEKEKFERLSSVDALTSIANRRHLQQRLGEELARCQRAGQVLSVVLLDVDHFKQINDRYGHQAGDAILVELAHRLNLVLRQEDVLGRWGGEEFLIVLPGLDCVRARVVAERLRIAVSAVRFEWVNQSIAVTISLGVDEIARGDSIDTLVSRADLHLYEAKSAGRNRVMG
jgi:diguanylate cyclase (GGDEF)-like protein